MFNFIQRLFASFIPWLTAWENLGNAASAASGVAKEAALAYEDEARNNRIAKAAAAAKEMKQLKSA